MKNPKKTNAERIASVEIKKTVSVIKCFICNQMFYSQRTFDDHMKLHSSKLTRNLPEEIQRKTMESFRVKKNHNLASVRQMGAAGRKVLNQTTSGMRPKMEEENQDDAEDVLNKKQIKQAEDVLRESTILIEKIQALISEEPEKQSKQQNSEQAQKQSPSVPQKQLTQQQFLQLAITNPKISISQTLNTKFSNQYLQSCQDQLFYLKTLLSHLQKDEVNLPKYQKMTSTILEAMVKYIQENAVVQRQKQDRDEDEEEEGMYLTGVGGQGKRGKSQKEIIQEEEERVEIVENEEVVYCNQCYMVIQYGEQCYRDKIDQKRSKQPRSYHIDCWQLRRQRPT